MEGKKGNLKNYINKVKAYKEHQKNLNRIITHKQAIREFNLAKSNDENYKNTLNNYYNCNDNIINTCNDLKIKYKNCLKTGRTKCKVNKNNALKEIKKNFNDIVEVIENLTDVKDKQVKINLDTAQEYLKNNKPILSINEFIDKYNLGKVSESFENESLDYDYAYDMYKDKLLDYDKQKLLNPIIDKIFELIKIEVKNNGVKNEMIDSYMYNIVVIFILYDINIFDVLNKFKFNEEIKKNIKENLKKINEKDVILTDNKEDELHVIDYKATSAKNFLKKNKRVLSVGGLIKDFLLYDVYKLFYLNGVSAQEVFNEYVNTYSRGDEIINDYLSDLIDIIILEVRQTNGFSENEINDFNTLAVLFYLNINILDLFNDFIFDKKTTDDINEVYNKLKGVIKKSSNQYTKSAKLDTEYIKKINFNIPNIKGALEYINNPIKKISFEKFVRDYNLQYINIGFLEKNTSCYEYLNFIDVDNLNNDEIKNYKSLLNHLTHIMRKILRINFNLDNKKDKADILTCAILLTFKIKLKDYEKYFEDKDLELTREKVDLAKYYVGQKPKKGKPFHNMYK